MDSLSAYARGRLNRDKELMVFDWNKAAQLIKQHRPYCARAGLRDDWEYTGGTIYENRQVPEKDTYSMMYLSSTWAVPELDLDGKIFECYRMQSEVPNWDCDTYWPEEIRKKLEE